ncbi:hypothetical protein ES708_25691 [subsurface metagenome]
MGGAVAGRSAGRGLEIGRGNGKVRAEASCGPSASSPRSGAKVVARRPKTSQERVQIVGRRASARRSVLCARSRARERGGPGGTLRGDSRSRLAPLAPSARPAQHETPRGGDLPPPLFPSSLASCLALRLSPGPALLSLSFRQGPWKTTHTRSLARARRGLLRRPLRPPTASAPVASPLNPPAPGGGRGLARGHPSVAPPSPPLRAAGPEDARGIHPKTPAGPGPAALRSVSGSAPSLNRRPPSTAATSKRGPKAPYKPQQPRAPPLPRPRPDLPTPSGQSRSTRMVSPWLPGQPGPG